MFKYLLTILIFLIGKPVLSQCIDDEGEMYDYRLTGISIEGSTNINRFSFSYNNPPISPAKIDTLKTIEGWGMVDFKIPLESFQGSVPAMKNDFMVLLKANEYPEVVVAIEEDKLNCTSDDVIADDIKLTVVLAGVRRAVPADFKSYVNSDEKMILSGSTKFLLSDFHLEPPEKALGLIQVRNEVFIKFDIVIKDLTNDGVQALK